MSNIDTIPNWWKIVQIVADLMRSDFEEVEFAWDHMKTDFLEKGFDVEDIERASQWIEKVAASGHFLEIMSMLKPQGQGTRIASPLEIACLPKKIWNRIEICRKRGILSNELVEKVLEGMRILDTRDWDEEEVSIVLAELLSTILPGTSEKEFLAILEGVTPEFYC
ncbi:MAG: DUF494 family protein [Oligoflexales bacterium]|nr:DUF494 family protein [Oligoflexales bacterium]